MNKFIVSESEKERILSLHKKANSNFYLMKEQSVESENSNIKTINFNFNYPSGWWSENTPNLVQSIKEKLKEINEFIKTRKGSKVTITVEVGESKVPNYNGEDPNIENIKKLKYKEKIKYRMPEGQLASYRADVIKRVLDEIFNQYYEQEYINEKPIIVPITKVDGPDFNSLVDNPNDEKFTKYQYVRLILSASGKKYEECKIDLFIEINYDKSSNDRGINHECNAALFQINANDITLKTIKGTDADMNNGSKPWPPKAEKKKEQLQTKEFINSNPDKPGSYRYNQFQITPELGKQLLSNSADGNITIRSICMTPKDEDRGKGFGKCHQEVPHVIIKDKTGKIVKDFFPNSAEGVICVLDKCGNFIK
jgi:hypothetical protein